MKKGLVMVAVLSMGIVVGVPLVCHELRKGIRKETHDA